MLIFKKISLVSLFIAGLSLSSQSFAAISIALTANIHNATGYAMNLNNGWLPGGPYPCIFEGGNLVIDNSNIPVNGSLDAVQATAGGVTACSNATFQGAYTVDDDAKTFCAFNITGSTSLAGGWTKISGNVPACGNYKVSKTIKDNTVYFYVSPSS